MTSWRKDILIQINKQRGILCTTSVSVFTTSLPLSATQIINIFLLQGLQPITIKGLGFQQIWEFLYSLMFLQCRISFNRRVPAFLGGKVDLFQNMISKERVLKGLYCISLSFRKTLQQNNKDEIHLSLISVLKNLKPTFIIYQKGSLLRSFSYR